MKRGEFKEAFNRVSGTIIGTARETAHDVHELRHVITALRSPYALISLAYQGVLELVETVDEALAEPNNQNALPATEDNSLFSGDLAGWDFENIL